MKKILFLLAILPLLAFASCSSDDDDSKVDFDYNIEMLYGQWQATSVELGGVNIDITSMVAPTFVTFKEGGVYSSKGVLGDGTGHYSTKGKTVIIVLGGSTLAFDMTSLSATQAKILLNAKALNLEIIPPEVEYVTVVLTKK